MRARLVDGPAWRGHYRGVRDGNAWHLRTGDVVEGAEAERLLADYPHDFEPVPEGAGEKMATGLDKMVRPGRYPNKAAKRRRKVRDDGAT